VTVARIAAAAMFAALAVLCALLAADVRAWQAALVRGDAVYAVAPAAAEWTPVTRLGGLAQAALGVDGDVASRRALALYEQVVGLHERLDNALQVEAMRVAAINALALPADSPDPARASQARTLLGILAFGAAAEGGGTTQTDAAISDFTDAVRLDPGNDAAKFDLELLLRLTAPHGKRSGSGQSSGFGRTGRRGAAGGVPGSGY
jgi:hypothetical protein